MFFAISGEDFSFLSFFFFPQRGCADFPGNRSPPQGPLVTLQGEEADGWSLNVIYVEKIKNK